MEDRRPFRDIDPFSFFAIFNRIGDEKRLAILGELKRALDASVRLLKPNGRLVIVSFHSLEDRLVKNFLIEHSVGHAHQNRYARSVVPPEQGLFTILTRKPITASAAELAANPRSHSAKLRAAQRTA